MTLMISSDKFVPATEDNILDRLRAAIGPAANFCGLTDEEASLEMSEEDEIDDIPFVEGLVASAINLAQAREGLMKSFTYLELILRMAWDPTEEELAAAIARSPYAGTTVTNDWMEAPVMRTGRVVYLAAEGKRKMHRKRARMIMRNNLGVHSKKEQNRILEKVKIVSIRSQYNVLKRKNPHYHGIFQFFGFDRETGRYQLTEFGEEFFDTLRKHQDKVEAQRDIFLQQEGLSVGDIEQINNFCDKERYVMATIDTFGALWGVSSLDGTGLQAANQRVNAECDDVDISAIVIAHTVKSEDVEADDHRKAGSGKVEMHSTVENTHYARPINQAEYNRLTEKGETGKQEDYVSWRVGKTNLLGDMRTRLLVRKRDHAPICISRKLGLLDDTSVKMRGGFSDKQLIDDLVASIEEEWRPESRFTANSIQVLIEAEEWGRPSLRHLGKNGGGKKKLVTVKDALIKAAAAGRLRNAGKHRGGSYYVPAREF